MDLTKIRRIYPAELRDQLLNVENKTFHIRASRKAKHIAIIIIIIYFLHGLGCLTCSGIDALPLFPGASTISSSFRFVVEGVFRKSGVVHSFEMVDPVLFVFGFHLYLLLFFLKLPSSNLWDGNVT